ncbi:MAG: biotin--[acetyl-CoA-carboxylase] ligase, partial [Fimbriimonadaceae bacterium]|nr:biotin--[acetyl-CoA-carboxylase] ligase [Alphaproteobacteria bacterium]
MADKGLHVPAPYRVVRFDDIDSTNQEALRLAEAGVREDTWIVAKTQTGGRGRRNRRWISEKGNLYASLLVFPRCDLSVAGGLAFVTGLAILRACAELAPGLVAGFSLKWPNDLLLRGKKIGGILLESAGHGGAGSYALVIGCGINCRHHPADMPYETTDLMAAGQSINIDHLFEAYAHHFDDLRGIWQEGAGFAQIRTLWLMHAAGLKTEIVVRLPKENLTGIFEDIDSSGQLILKTANG